LNLARLKPGDVILDPFCGIGTFLQEGMLLDFKVLGTDIDKVAISGAEKNLEWFRNRYKVAKGKYHVEVSDAKTASKIVENLKRIGAFKKISAVVTEGTLGPVYSKYPKPNEVQENFQHLSSLHADSFADFSKLLESKSRIVMCLPAYKKTYTEYEMFPTLDFASKNGYTMVDIIPPSITGKFNFLKLTNRGTVIYDRKDQIVAREIVVFEKN